MKLLKLIIVSLLITSASFSFAQTEAPKDIKPEYSTNHPVQAIFFTPEEKFKDLDVDVHDLARWMKETDITFAKNFSKEIEDENGEAKMLAIFIIISAINKPIEVCEQDYTNCVLITYDIKKSDNISEEKFEQFKKDFNKIKEIKIGNPQSKEKAVLALYMGTKAPKPSYSCKPSDYI